MQEYISPGPIDSHRSVMTVSSNTPTSHSSTPSLTQSLSYRPEHPGVTDTALQYCLRVINQCERS